MMWTEIKSVDELLLIRDMEGCYKIKCDLDLGDRIYIPIGSEDEPFKGIIDGEGHHIRNINIRANDATNCYGLVAVNEGTIQNLVIENFNLFGESRGTANAGIFAGINYGKIYGAHCEGGVIDVTSYGTIIAGTFAGTNYGEIVNGVAGADMKLGGTATMYVGGLVGKTFAGLLETLESTGEIKLYGDEKKIHAGVYASVAETTILRANTFSSPWNVINGKLFRKLYDSKKNIITDGNLWRDNRNDDRLLSKKKLEVRKIVEEHMRRMGSVEWTPNKTLEHTCTCLGKVHYQKFEAGVKQYGIPYSHHGGSYERFMACFDENGNLQPWVKTEGYDGFDLYIGNDCSMAVYFALARITGNIEYEWTWTGTPMWKKGPIPIPGYDAMFTDQTGDIIKKNGKQKMAEAFAKQHVGDPMVHAKVGSGHFRLVAKNAVIYRQDDGQIDCKKSYCITHEQGDGLLYEPQIGPSRSWLLDHHYTLEHLFGEEFIPMTMPELQKGEVMKPEITCKNTGKGIDALTSGKVKSNYRIISLKTKLTSEDGTEVMDKLIFPDIHGYDGHGNDKKVMPMLHKELDKFIAEANDRDDHITRLKKEYNMRETIREVDLDIFKPYVNEALELKKGEKYHYSLEVMLTNGEIYTVCEKDIKY